MKRSEMIELIHKYMREARSPHGSDLLKVLEDAGMTPPVAFIQKSKSTQKIQVLGWEPEDEK